MKTTMTDVCAQLTEKDLASDLHTPAEIAHDLAARLDKATDELVQKDADLSAASHRFDTLILERDDARVAVARERDTRLLAELEVGRLAQKNANLSAVLERLERDLAQKNATIQRTTAQRDELKAALDASDEQHKRALSTIKALVEALLSSGYGSGGDWHSAGCDSLRGGECAEFCAARRAALRMAEVLK